MPNVFRAYVPTVKFDFNVLNNVATAALPSVILATNVDSRLVHRKVWCYLWTSNPNLAMDFDLIAKLRGGEVYRQKIGNYTSAALSSFLSGYQQVTTSIGAVNEQIFARINGASMIAACPWRLNITADEFSLAINSISSPGLWDAGLFVMSQQGI